MNQSPIEFAAYLAEQYGKEVADRYLNPKALPGIRCCHCNSIDHGVIYTRDDASGIKRRRQCKECGEKFSTIETVDVATTQIMQLQRRFQNLERVKSLLAELAEAMEGIN